MKAVLCDVSLNDVSIDDVPVPPFNIDDREDENEDEIAPLHMNKKDDHI